MDLRVLRNFLAVTRAENITRAAESLHMAQPSLSKQMVELEKELGRPLLLRGRRLSSRESAAPVQKWVDGVHL